MAIKKEIGKETYFQSEGEIRYTSVLAAFSGFADLKKDGKILAKEYRVSDYFIYNIFEKLHEEFPDKFPGLYFSDTYGSPYSKELERMLFKLGAFGMLEQDVNNHYYVVSPEATLAIQKVLKETCGENNLEKFIPVAKRFRKLAK